MELVLLLPIFLDGGLFLLVLLGFSVAHLVLVFSSGSRSLTWQSRQWQSRWSQTCNSHTCFLRDYLSSTFKSTYATSLAFAYSDVRCDSACRQLEARHYIMQPFAKNSCINLHVFGLVKICRSMIHIGLGLAISHLLPCKLVFPDGSPVHTEATVARRVVHAESTEV
mmetsp:Transcript_81036/g.143542  ORF Transcript_81036/g.143542 Transcript_81036/m.143542 type:complete len:167 (-) Transcript_81036:87-587(-)